MSSAPELARLFADPPRAFGFMPFWFWNDDLDEAELLRQVREFHAKGFGGFIPSARTGLSRRVGYLTPEFFRLMRLVVAEAARLDMKVVLYDEGTYPSGSAQGRVVAENPDWAAKCLTQISHTVQGPVRGLWRPNPGRALGQRLVSVVAARETAPNILAPESLHGLAWDEHELVAYDLPAGSWRLVAVWEGHSGGIIRGVFEEEEDGHALAPPAADILREDAVTCFIRFTHDAYYRELKEYFGTTVVAMFTDEPNPMGRTSRGGLRPWTPGFLTQLQPWWDEDAASWLPALWFDCGPRTAAFRWAYHKAVQQRLEQAFYKPIGDWCAAHGIALTGHAGDSNEMGMLRQLHWPGQDLVWRYVTPDKPTGTEPKHSLTAKAASSAARLGCRRFNATEAYGAYGWRLTCDEMKWLLDWHLVRGTNLIFPHAAFYSIRGRRAFESEPDLAVHNVWWPHFGLLGDYGRRLCWLFSDGDLACHTGIVSDGDSLAWRAAWALEPAQQEFIFLDDPALQAAKVEAAGEQPKGALPLAPRRGGERPPRTPLCSLAAPAAEPAAAAKPSGVPPEPPHTAKGNTAVPLATSSLSPTETPSDALAGYLQAGSQRLRLLVVDEPGTLSAAAEQRLAEFAAVGGGVLRQWSPETLAAQVAALIGRDVEWQSERGQDLRAMHYRRDGFDFFLLVNEGEQALDGHVLLAATGAVCRWDAMDGSTRPWPATQADDGRLRVPLRLERREAAVLAVDPIAAPDPHAAVPPRPGNAVAEITGPWTVTDAVGKPVGVPCPGDWAQTPGWEAFTGTLCYHAEFAVAAGAPLPRFLDLGRVGDIAEVLVNGRRLGVCAWAPYVLDLGDACRAGTNRLEVRVTNSMANAYDGLQLPSGLLGPVCLRRAAS